MSTREVKNLMKAMGLEYKVGDTRLNKAEMIDALVDCWTDPDRLADQWG